MGRKRLIHVGYFRIGSEERRAVMDVLDSGRISEGKKVREFEIKFAEFVGTKYAVAISSGTSALIAGLLALIHVGKIRPGSKVITTPLTYVATSNAIVRSGLAPVYVDVDRKTFGITPENIENHLKKAKNLRQYSLILPVHLMGYPCRMDEINKIARKYNLLTFEDSAQAHGSLYKGRKTGAWSFLSAFSFYIAHNIQAGELGAITTDNEEIVRMVRKIKANGRMCDCFVCVRGEGKCPKISLDQNEDHDPRFTHDFIGLNLKTMEFQAALALSQLSKVKKIIEKRRDNVDYLNRHLRQFSRMLDLPPFSKEVSYLAYPLVIKNPRLISRKKMRIALEKSGIETRPIFGSIPTQQPAYKYLKKGYEGKLPVADYIGKNGFYIGCHQYMTRDDLAYIVKVFADILG
jgi:dTDP-4-amino-4,6-dideoxygalactose transaminase